MSRPCIPSRPGRLRSGVRNRLYGVGPERQPQGPTIIETRVIETGRNSAPISLERTPLYLKVLALMVSLACVVPQLGAQTGPSGAVPVVPGSRVRVKTPNLVAPLIANFLEQRADTLVFIEDGTGRGVWALPLSQIQRLERTAGEAGQNRKPLATGVVVGAGVGLVGGVLFARYFSPSDSTREYNSVLTGLLGAGVGAGLGGFVGSRIKRERWINIPLPRQFSLRANGRRAAISYSFR